MPAPEILTNLALFLGTALGSFWVGTQRGKKHSSNGHGGIDKATLSMMLDTRMQTLVNELRIELRNHREDQSEALSNALMINQLKTEQLIQELKR